MKRSKVPLPKGVGSALLAALLFGLSTPLAKLLLGELPPLLLAGLLYLGSGIGLTSLRLVRRLRGTPAAGLAGLAARDVPWLAGAVVFGGLIGPVLLNLEGVFTALLAWFVFKENVERRIALGMGLIVAGGVALSWQGSEGLVLPLGALAVAGASL